MLNAGRGTAQPGVGVSIRYNGFVDAELIAHSWLFAPYGDDSVRVLSTPGSAPQKVASPGVQHNWAASQPPFKHLP